MYKKLEGLTYEDIKTLKELWQQREFEKFDLGKDTIYEINGGYFLFEYINIDSKTGEGVARFCRYNQEGRYSIGRDNITLNHEEVKVGVIASNFKPADDVYNLMREIDDVKYMKLTSDEREDEIHKLENKIRDIVKACPHNFKDRHGNDVYTCQVCGYEYTLENDGEVSDKNINGIKIW